MNELKKMIDMYKKQKIEMMIENELHAQNLLSTSVTNKQIVNN